MVMKRSLGNALVLGLVAAVFGCGSSGSSGNSGAAGNAAAGTGQGTGGTSNPSGGAGNVSGAPSTGGGSNPAGGTNVGGATAAGANAGGASGAGTAGMTSAAGAAAVAGAGGGLGAFTGIDFGTTSDGGTVTYQNIGATGSYPSVCAPTGNMCCKKTVTVTSDKLTPWDQELIMTLRGPLDIRQFATYQPTVEGQASPWKLVSSWDARNPAGAKGIAFSGNATPNTAFKGTIGSVCLVNASTDKPFGCGTTSNPYCAAGSQNQNAGWAGSKMFVVLASAPHVGTGGITTAQSCVPAGDNWSDAPWFGISLGELIREGAFSNCNCYTVKPNVGDGCGQINALEVINDNNSFANLELFSSNFFSYGGDFGGPCPSCKTAGLPANVDLVTSAGAATVGALGAQNKGANGFLRRPSTGFRYFIFLLDVTTRTVQYALINPKNVPPTLAALLPNLPAEVPQATIDSMIGLRLPH